MSIKDFFKKKLEERTTRKQEAQALKQLGQQQARELFQDQQRELALRQEQMQQEQLMQQRARILQDARDREFKSMQPTSEKLKAFGRKVGTRLQTAGDKLKASNIGGQARQFGAGVVQEIQTTPRQGFGFQKNPVNSLRGFNQSKVLPQKKTQTIFQRPLVQPLPPKNSVSSVMPSFRQGKGVSIGGRRLR